MNKRLLFAASILAMMASSAQAQELKEGYIKWGKGGSDFPTAVKGWKAGTPAFQDENFFVSRVKPRATFRNANTQVRNLTVENDKRLINWVPVSDPGKMGLPDGVFDSEVFTMWPYVTHWGHWSSQLGSVPAAFLDAAHKNGVAVTSVAGIPYGSINQANSITWRMALPKIGDLNAETTANYLHYYGVDGLGYNSEFGGGAAIMKKLIPFHVALHKAAKVKNPLFENMWYDGTNDYGNIYFDYGLGEHNDDIFGKAGAEGASLFFNYNWNNDNLLQRSVKNAKDMGRDPLYLYAGFNMQGAEPKSGERWPLLAKYPISIGLWGAHTRNMFWESRGELGSTPDAKQRSYLLRTERWFTGGTRNPANTPVVTSSMKYNVENYSFHGMSSFMTARSVLSWDLAQEPFITYFNLGNGKYFNWQGKQQHSQEWYNIGVQDYLPTWRWWWTKSLLGRQATDVAESGLNAEFTWDDAYMGGSSLRINGTSAGEYLHLFKTKYALQAGDVITLRYKLIKGKANIGLVLTAEGAETAAINEADFQVMNTAQDADGDVWVEKKFTLTDAFNGKTLALAALHVEKADNLDLYLGEFSIVRQAAVKPAQPQITASQILAFGQPGADAKLIFNMPNDKPAGEPCYNSDVNTSLFKLYAQQEGKDAVLMGVTTSWAGMFYNIPLQLTAPKVRLRLGVSALSMDHKSESDIAWTDYQVADAYKYSDDIQISKSTIKPNEAFELSYVDPLHEEGTWEIVDAEGKTIFTATGNKVEVKGLEKAGSYNLRLKGQQYDATGTKREETTRVFASFVQITPQSVGALPQVLTLTQNGKESDISLKLNEAATFTYTGRDADGKGSQGVNLKEDRFGIPCKDIKVDGKKSFGVAFWTKFNSLASGETQLLSIASKQDGWPKTDWGWIWTTVRSDGKLGSFTFRGTDATQNNELRYIYENTKLPIGNWVHLAYNFEYNDQGKFRCDFYVNGVKQAVTKWNRSNNNGASGEPPFQGDVYSITGNQVLAFGGTAHGRNGIDGVMDNFQVWNRAITAEDVAKAMGDITTAPEGLLANWDFETVAGADKLFAASQGDATLKAGLHNYQAAGGEGQGLINWVAPTYTAGSPFLTGTAYEVKTLPTWTTKKGTITEATGNSTAGSAKIAWSKDGTYNVTLTLANAYGSDSKTFTLIKVGTGNGIATGTAAQLRTQTVGRDVLVEVPEAGQYTVAVYNLAGQVVAQQSAQMTAGQQMQLHLGTPGTYVLRVLRAGLPLHATKLIAH